MLGGPGHDRAALRQPARHAEEREVDRLGARAREGDLGAVGAHRTRGQVASAIQRRPRGSSFAMRAGRIAFGEVAQRRLDLRQDGRESRVVEKDAAHAAINRGCGPAGGKAL